MGMAKARKEQIEFGDFQTPDTLATAVCKYLRALGIRPDAIVEPTCGIGAFVIAAMQAFPAAEKLIGLEMNIDYLRHLQARLQTITSTTSVTLLEADFFTTQWQPRLASLEGNLLVLGNFPWVTNSMQGTIGGENLPRKTNFQKQRGIDALTGKANFDISESMLLEVLNWFRERRGTLAMLVKTAIARKVLAHAGRQGLVTSQNSIIKIDAKKSFNVSVDACLLIMHFNEKAITDTDYWVFEGLQSEQGKRVGHRMGLSIADLDVFDAYHYLLGKSPKQWRSGVKHDAAAVMELTLSQDNILRNGYGEKIDIESRYLYPLMKGSDIGSNKTWCEKYILITQHSLGEPTKDIQIKAPKTWAYLQKYAPIFEARASSIYAKKPPFSIFGIGDYAFRPWRIAICGLYKSLTFRLIAPIADKPVMFDDTVYYISFDSELATRQVFHLLNTKEAKGLLTAMIFWDEKRPIKASILNALDWSRLPQAMQPQGQLSLDFTR